MEGDEDKERETPNGPRGRRRSEGSSTGGAATLLEEEQDTKASTRLLEPPRSSFQPSMWEEALACLRRPLFVWSALGYAGYSGGLIGFSTFGPAFVMALGYFETEYVASMVFGVSMAVAGLLGTPIGGVLMDFRLASVKASLLPPFDAAASMSCGFNLVGTIIAGVCVWAYPAWLFMACICVGATFMFASTASMNLAVLESVHPENRSFAIAFSVLIMHALGA